MGLMGLVGVGFWDRVRGGVKGNGVESKEWKVRSVGV